VSNGALAGRGERRVVDKPTIYSQPFGEREGEVPGAFGFDKLDLAQRNPNSLILIARRVHERALFRAVLEYNFNVDKLIGLSHGLRLTAGCRQA
jgi:hypothetical protein